jgi:hypothetical protein
MITAKLPDHLGEVTLSTPCHVEWESMQGDHRVRFCGQCAKNVYNVEGLTAAEVKEVLLANEGQACLRLFIREDGTALTQDCPVGLMLVGKVWNSEKKRARLHFKSWWGAYAAAAVSVVVILSGHVGDGLRRKLQSMRECEVAPTPAAVVTSPVTRKVMGGMKLTQNNYY